VTSLHEFFAQKRQERSRGKLAGLSSQIRELKDLGASYKEIAEYLHLEYGLTVTRGGLQKHLKSLRNKPSADITSGISFPAPGPPSRAVERPNPSLPEATPAKTSARSEAFTEQGRTERDKIPTRAETPADDVVTSYRLGSSEHQAILAAYRQNKNRSQP
jgi:hypothetical protein